MISRPWRSGAGLRLVPRRSAPACSLSGSRPMPDADKGWIVNNRGLKADGFPADLARVRIRGHRSPVLRLVYSSPIPDVQGSVEISIRGVAAVLAKKLGLALAVAILAMSAVRASAGRIAEVDQHDRHARELGLVLHEQTQSREAPPRLAIPVLGSKRCPIANSLGSSRALPRSVSFAFWTKSLLMQWLSCLRKRASRPASFLSFFLAPLLPRFWNRLQFS